MTQSLDLEALDYVRTMWEKFC